MGSQIKKERHRNVVAMQKTLKLTLEIQGPFYLMQERNFAFFTIFMLFWN